MNRFACLVIVATFAMPCLATGPKVDRTIKPKRASIDTRQFVFMRPKLVVPPKVLDDQTVRAILFPFTAYAERVTDRVKWHRRMLEKGWQVPHGPYWPLLD
jgi:hypothetical protein